MHDAIRVRLLRYGIGLTMLKVDNEFKRTLIRAVLLVFVQVRVETFRLITSHGQCGASTLRPPCFSSVPINSYAVAATRSTSMIKRKRSAASTLLTAVYGITKL